jgi:hypothetical protein
VAASAGCFSWLIKSREFEWTWSSSGIVANFFRVVRGRSSLLLGWIPNTTDRMSDSVLVHSIIKDCTWTRTVVKPLIITCVVVNNWSSWRPESKRNTESHRRHVDYLDFDSTNEQICQKCFRCG